MAALFCSPVSSNAIWGYDTSDSCVIWLPVCRRRSLMILRRRHRQHRRSRRSRRFRRLWVRSRECALGCQVYMYMFYLVHFHVDYQICSLDYWLNCRAGCPNYDFPDCSFDRLIGHQMSFLAHCNGRNGISDYWAFFVFCLHHHKLSKEVSHFLCLQRRHLNFTFKYLLIGKMW